MLDDLKNTSFVEFILKTMKEKQVTVMEAVILLHETQDIEIEKLASLVKGSPKLKAALLAEAQQLKMVR